MQKVREPDVVEDRQPPGLGEVRAGPSAREPLRASDQRREPVGVRAGAVLDGGLEEDRVGKRRAQARALREPDRGLEIQLLRNLVLGADEAAVVRGLAPGRRETRKAADTCAAASREPNELRVLPPERIVRGQRVVVIDDLQKVAGFGAEADPSGGVPTAVMEVLDVAVPGLRGRVLIDRDQLAHHQELLRGERCPGAGRRGPRR